MSSDRSSAAITRIPKRGRNGFIKSSLIKVIVGFEINREQFLIHNDIIIPRSKFFANRLSGRWGNSETDTVNLFTLNPNMEPQALARYLEVVYTSEIVVDAIFPINLWIFAKFM
ncbi:hypothetical protein J1614_001868 [Plenodomus biglobosus]|nr:hypothetical protein J1614_001868 [Plenodomus biglobosus]